MGSISGLEPGVSLALVLTVAAGSNAIFPETNHPDSLTSPRAFPYNRNRSTPIAPCRSRAGSCAANAHLSHSRARNIPPSRGALRPAADRKNRFRPRLQRRRRSSALRSYYKCTRPGDGTLPKRTVTDRAQQGFRFVRFYFCFDEITHERM